MKYDVEVAADELMLTTEELKEIFEYYFDDAVECVASCYTANSKRDYITVAKKIHALKGASMNLRMDEIIGMAIELESLANQEEKAEITQYLPKIGDKLEILKDEIYAFYNRSI